MEVLAGHFRAFASMFPNAKIAGGSMDSFWTKLEAVKETLPVFTGEVADTWIYGVQSDPWKVAAFRAMQREWTECSPSKPAGERPTFCDGATPQQLDDVAEYLLLAGKHTWGRGCGAGNTPHGWLNDEFAELRRTENKTSDQSFASCERAWAEQRMQLQAAAAAAAGTELGRRLSASVTALTPEAPNTTELTPIPAAEHGRVVVLGGKVKVGLDPRTGAIITLEDVRSHEAYATPANPLAEIWYQTGSEAEEMAWNLNYSVTFPDPWGGYNDFDIILLPARFSQRRYYRASIVYYHCAAR